MSERVIPVIDQRNLRATIPGQAIPATGLLGDRLMVDLLRSSTLAI